MTPDSDLPPFSSIALKEWWHYSLKLVARCTCGREAEVHTAELLKRYGQEGRIGDYQIDALKRSIHCIRCHARPAELWLEIRRS